MRWIKFVAIVSLWLFFFGVLAIVHLWISVLRLPNRWKIVSRWMRGFTWSMRRILDIKIEIVRRKMRRRTGRFEWTDETVTICHGGTT